VAVKSVPEAIRIFWEFYQKEGPQETRCGFDNARKAPADGIPFLTLYKGDSAVPGPCYGSTSTVYLKSELL
jgi:hypothetical protein